MTAFIKKFAFSLSFVALVFAFSAQPAEAQRSKVKHSHVAKKKAKPDAETRLIVKRAQEHLAHMGYYVGKIDGIMGPATKAAIKSFQRKKGMKVDGILGSQTRLALEEADRVILPRKSPIVVKENRTPEDMQPHQDYEPPLHGGSKVVSSRFARLDVSETGQGADKRYAVNLDGQPILMAEGQPSVVGISTTYDLGEQDAVIFTTFSPTEDGCIYRNRVLAMNASGHKMFDIDNCTRTYQARVDKGSLFIVFPERDDNRAVGATWRLDGMTLNRL